jgi:hypothetical protein
MSKKLNVKGNFSNKAGQIKFNLPLISFQEDNLYFIYSPALDVTGYGSTEQDARDSFQEAISQFFDYTTNKKTFEAELKKLGWKFNKKQSVPPTLVDMIINNKYLAEIFTEKQYKKFDEPVSIPVLA